MGNQSDRSFFASEISKRCHRYIELASNVFWQVGSSATLGTNSSFEGTILTQTSITLNTGADLTGRARALDGKVTLDNNIVQASTLRFVTFQSRAGRESLPAFREQPSMIQESLTDLVGITSGANAAVARRQTLEVLRQPLEDGHVTISRAAGSLTFPARFMMVAALNPCGFGRNLQPPFLGCN